MLYYCIYLKLIIKIWFYTVKIKHSWINTSKKSLSTLRWKVWKLWPASTLMERQDTALVSAPSTSILQCSFLTLHRLIWCRAIQQVKETCLPKAVITKSLRVNWLWEIYIYSHYLLVIKKLYIFHANYVCILMQNFQQLMHIASLILYLS